MSVTIRIETSQMDQLASDIAQLVAEQVRISAFVIQGKAQIDAPVDTGTLQGSAVVAPSETKQGAWDVGFTAEYAMEVHQGTHLMSGRPFLVNAMNNEVDNLKASIARVVQK